jgi:acyl CoA:acetate/3-ketoacid CoA transferase
MYITERAVFRLTRDSIELTEIAPGVDLERDVLARMAFRPHLADTLKQMPAHCFHGGTSAPATATATAMGIENA